MSTDYSRAITLRLPEPVHKSGAAPHPSRARASEGPRSSAALAQRDLGLVEWHTSLNDEELRYGLVRAWEGVELMREMERPGLEHPFKKVGRTPLNLLAPEEIAERTDRASREHHVGGASQGLGI